MRILTIICIATITALLPLQARACSCSERIDAEASFERATSVILAEITDTKLIKTVHKEHDLEYILANIDILETFKSNGYPVTQVLDLVLDQGNCSIGLMSGLEYIFFIDTRPDEESLDPDNYVGMCTGSHAVNIYHKDFEKERRALRDISKSTASFSLNE